MGKGGGREMESWERGTVAKREKTGEKWGKDTEGQRERQGRNGKGG